MTHLTLTLTTALAITLAACSTTDPPPTPLTPPNLPICEIAQAGQPDHPACEPLPDLQGSETGAAVGTLIASPTGRSVIKWLGQIIMQAITNTTVQVTVTQPAP